MVTGSNDKPIMRKNGEKGQCLCHGNTVFLVSGWKNTGRALPTPNSINVSIQLPFHGMRIKVSVDNVNVNNHLLQNCSKSTTKPI